MSSTIITESNTGNKYIFDGSTGLIFNDKIPNIEKYNLYDSAVEFDFLDNFTEQDIRNYLIAEGSGFNQLLLEMTSSCNMRCRYCIYSDHYHYMKGYEGQFMSLETAKRAVDLYFDYFKQAYFDEPLPDLIRRLDQDYWKKGVDDRDVYGSCSECTMRYSCPRCRYTERADRCAVLEELS